MTFWKQDGQELFSFSPLVEIEPEEATPLYSLSTSLFATSHSFVLSC